MKEATGIDLSQIVNAESYDAKVNRNINLTSDDPINVVVHDKKDTEKQDVDM